MQVKVLIARFPYGNIEVPDVGDYLTKITAEMKADPRISHVAMKRYDDTPITMTRNRALKDAKAAGIDIVLMIDSDMSPDLPGYQTKPFWKSSFDFWWERHKQHPCLIASPYCGPPPHENIYIFKWATYQSDHPDKSADIKLDQFTREEVFQLRGIQEVAALPTGLILIDMRALERLKPPHFYYEYSDGDEEAEKCSTEDVTFTRDCSLSNVPVYCNWDAWSGHWKRKRVGKPHMLTAGNVRAAFREAVLMNIGVENHEEHCPLHNCKDECNKTENKLEAPRKAPARIQRRIDATVPTLPDERTPLIEFKASANGHQANGKGAPAKKRAKAKA